MLVIDGLIIAVAFVIGASLRDPIVTALSLNLPPKVVLNEIWWMLVIAVIVMPFLLYQFNFYASDLRKKFSYSLWVVVQSSAILGGLIGALVIFLQLDASSRLAVGTSFSILVIALLIRDRLWIRYRRHLAKSDRYRELVLFAGSASDMESLLGDTPENITDYWDIVATFDFKKHDVEELRNYLDEYSVQRVVFSVDDSEFRKLSRAIEICEIQGVEAWVNAGFIRTQLARPDFDSLGGKPMLVLRSTPDLSWELFGKEVLDRLGAFILILFALPFLVVAYIGIMFTSPGHSPIFIQDRSGRFGKSFRMYKLRTMIPDAEAKLAEVKKDQGNQMEGPVFKLDADPRVFKFGSFLRKTSIDELPQLFNVLLGDMSLVGPRPLPVYEVKEFEEAKHRRRLSVKPGITCTWQAGGRNSITSFEEWVDMDLEYIDSWSLWKDISILLRTIPAVLFSKGAK